MFDKAKAVEGARAKLARQEENLKETLGQIDYIEKSNPKAVALIKSLKTKRDRQAAAIKATEQLIEIYEPALPGLEKDTKKR